MLSCVHDVPSFVVVSCKKTHLHKHTLSLIKSLHQELFGIFLFSKKKTTHNPMFSQRFLGNKSFNTK
jgi:hypothetical protein